MTFTASPPHGACGYYTAMWTLPLIGRSRCGSVRVGELPEGDVFQIVEFQFDELLSDQGPAPCVMALVVRSSGATPGGWVGVRRCDTGLEFARRAADTEVFASASTAAERLRGELPGLRPDEAELRFERVRSFADAARGDQLLDKARNMRDADAAVHAQQAGAHADLRRRAAQAQATSARARAAHEQKREEAQALAARVRHLEKELAETRAAARAAEQAARRLRREQDAAGAAEQRATEGAVRAASAEEQARAAAAAAGERLAELRAAVGGAARQLAAVAEALPGRWAAWEREHEQWAVEDVTVWLRRARGGKFAAHADEFAEQGVTGAMLVDIPPDELAALGVRNYALRRELREAIAALAAPPANQPPPERLAGAPRRRPSASPELRTRAPRRRSVAPPALREAIAAPPPPPERFVCPVTRDLFEDPVVIAGDEQGNPYERHAIEEWFRDNATVPLTRQPLFDEAARALQPLHALRREVREWREQHHQ